MNFMNLVEYMSFDPSWFTTKAGLCVTGGLVLVIIGAVLFIIGGKKKADTPVEEAPVEVVPEANSEVAPVEATPVSTEEVAVPAVEETPAEVLVESPVVEAAPEVVATPAVEETVNVSEEVQPVAEPTEEVVPVVHIWAYVPMAPLSGGLFMNNAPLIPFGPLFLGSYQLFGFLFLILC